MKVTTPMIYRALLIASLTFFLSSCYKDLGNSVYDESIEDIQVKLDAQFRTRKPFSPTTFEITPTITTPSGKQHDLEYEWYINPNNPTHGEAKGTLVGTDPVLTFNLDPNDESTPLPDVYYIRLYVTDKTNGTLTLRNSELVLTNPFSYAWAILHARDGHSEIGTVEYDDGNTINTPDAYSRESGKILKGEPLGLNVRQDAFTGGGFQKAYASQLYVRTTDLTASGLIIPTEGFRLAAPWKGLISGAELSNFDPKDVHFGAGNEGVIFASKGNVFTNNAYGAAFYRSTPDAEDLPGETYISNLTVGAKYGVGYDSASHRFVITQSSGYMAWQDMFAKDAAPGSAPITKIRDDEDNVVSPYNIPTRYKLVDMFDGYFYGSSGTMPWAAYILYAYMIDDTESHVYTIRSREIHASKFEKEAPMGQVYSFPKPANVNEHTLMTTGPQYAYILFYADGNTVYRHDLATGSSTPIYTHDTPGATITALRMAVQGYQGFDEEGEAEKRYGHPFGQTLAVGFTIGADQGELVVLQLDNTGNIEAEDKLYPSVQVYKGYGPIKSIGFI